MAAIGDGDGDGITESAWFGRSSIVVVSGAELRSLCYGNPTDVAVGALVPFSGDQYASMAVGDWTGDGVEEWALVRVRPEEGEEAIWLLSADVAVSGEFTSDDAAGSWVLDEDMYSLVVVSGTPDFDGDGARDLALEEGGGGIVNIIPHCASLSVAADLPERRLRYTSWNSEGGIGDFNNDGFDDLLLTDTAPSGPPYWVNSWIMPGFEVPWDDEARW